MRNFQKNIFIIPWSKIIKFPAQSESYEKDSGLELIQT